MESGWIDELGGQGTADALVSSVARFRAEEAQQLQLVAHWAVLHDEASIQHDTDREGRVLPGTERAVEIGGDGTPQVAEFAVHELAALLGLPFLTARNLLADVLDLVHRHPVLWAGLQQTAHCADPGVDPALAVGLPQGWQATKVARRCRAAGLSLEAARWVDAHTTDDLGALPWSRFTANLEERIKEADPAIAEARRQAAEATKKVTVSRTNEDGLKRLTVQLPAAQIIWLRARLHQIAQLLQAQGATAPMPELEADAAFLLANPAQALQLLLWGATLDPQPTPAGTPDSTDGPTLPPDDTDLDGSAAEAADDTECAGDPEPADDVEPADQEPVDQDPVDEAEEPDPSAGLLDVFGDRRVRPVEPVSTGDGLQHPFDHPVFGDSRMSRRLHEHDAREHEPPDPATAPDPGHHPGPPPPTPAWPPPHGPDDRTSSPPAAQRGHPADDRPRGDSDQGSGPRPADHACPTCGQAPGHAPGESSAPGQVPTAPVGGRIDPAKLRPKAVLHLHGRVEDFRTGQGTFRVEHDDCTGVSHAEMVDLLGHAHVTVRPVIDLHHQTPVDAHEVPAELAEALRLLHPYTPSPYSTTRSRGRNVDDDHTKAYAPGDQPGQTRLDNLGPLGRGDHRYKTFGRGVTLAQPALGVFVWRTRHGYCFQVDQQGTHPLGKMTAAQFHALVAELALEDTDQLDAAEVANRPADLDRVLDKLRAG